ncbi:hypothetical protein CB0940_11722 [Cercospora beticola]|uniref:Mitochondrial export protein Som1 n=1 Tax=Cercospora beticola TaxID=122368 RepID=A0A2G5IEE6_CERBT|nr:hypothetical protein CB0940_11722 [Cercospora beticola]PIB03110.1 hypothetical protein CB0940_11722 [Cercospora beticola]WPB04077.1 hypothetical protein RHO25_008721 [Cercospora beticola]
MPPVVEAFHASELESRLNTLPSGKARKPPIQELKKDCELKELLQYNCEPEGEKGKQRVVCRPVLRLLRQCANGLTVETTAWENRYDGTLEKAKESTRAE